MSSAALSPPVAAEHAPYYAKYVALVPPGDVMATLEQQLSEVKEFLAGVPEERSEEPHGPYTWSFRQVVGHLADAERVFTYRALRFARKDPTPLPGFDENAFALNADFNSQRLADLADNFAAVRGATLTLLRGLDDAAWLRRGVANNDQMSVRAVAYVVAGHTRHHLGILRQRQREYL